jgi:hypothetical protein
LGITLVPGIAAAADTSAPKLRYQLVTGKGDALCTDYLKNLSDLHTEEPFSCEIRLSPKSAFHEPTWEELSVNENLQLIYQATMLLPPYTQSDVQHPSFEDWQKTFRGQIERKEVAPSLSRTRLALNQRGMETLIRYQPNRTDCERYKHNTGADMFVLRGADKLESIDGLAGTGYPTDVIVHRGRTIFIATGSESPGRWYTELYAAYSIMSPRQLYILQQRCDIKIGR